MSEQLRSNGKWLVRYTDDNGRSRGKTFAGKREAETYDAEMKRRRRYGEIVQQSDMKLGEFRERWSRVTQLAPKTRQMYDGIWNKHVEPELGNTPLSRVTGMKIQELIISLQRKGVGQATIVKVRTMLSGIFALAVLQRLVKENPIPLARWPRSGTSRIVEPLKLRPRSHATRCAASNRVGRIRSPS